MSTINGGAAELTTTVATVAGGGPTWSELLGSNNWSGILSPLDLSLLNFILLCGDLIQVTYDAFNSDAHSRFCGSSRYSPSAIFRRTLLPSAADFRVVSFLYATSSLSSSNHHLPPSFLLFSLSREAWSKESNWIGYVAVSSDSAARSSGRRVIYVVLRGTIRDLEWVDVLKPDLVSISPFLTSAASTDPKIMKGWYTIYTSTDSKSPFSKLSAREQLLAAVSKTVSKYAGEQLSIVCTGHSLGAALAVVAAFDIAESGLVAGGIPVSAVVFGCPQVGNKAFKERLEERRVRVLHVKQKADLIPLYPSGLLGYAFTGTELVVDGGKSPYLKDSKTVGDWHNLQGVLHVVAGWNGEEVEWGLRVKRSVALVNKSSEYLKDECLVPGSWWVEKNKGMVIGDDGEWGLADENDIPVLPGDVDDDELIDSGGGDDGVGEANGELPESSTAAVAAAKKRTTPYQSLVSCFGL